MANRSRWQPTWRRLTGTTVVLFAVILAFLAGRVRAGADPGLQTRAAATAAPAPQTSPGLAAHETSPGLGAPDSDPPTTHVS
jgi:hypothetical protein